MMSQPFRQTLNSIFAFVVFWLSFVSSANAAEFTKYTDVNAWKASVGHFEAHAFDEFYPGIANGAGCLAGPPGPTLNLQYGDVTARGFTMFSTVKGVAGGITEQCALHDSATNPQVSDGFIDSYPDAYFELTFASEVNSFFTFFSSLEVGEVGTLDAFNSFNALMFSFDVTSTDSVAAQGLGFTSTHPVKRIEFRSSESGPTLLGAFTTIGAGLGTKFIPSYAGPNGSTVEFDFACQFRPRAFTDVSAWTAAAGIYEARAFDEFFPGVANGGGCLVDPPTPGPILSLQSGAITIGGVANGEEACAVTDSATVPQVSDGFIDSTGGFSVEFDCAATAFFTFFSSLAEGEVGTISLVDHRNVFVGSFNVTSTHNSNAHGIGFVSLVPIKRVSFTSSEAGPTIVGAFTTIGAGLGTVEIPKYSGPNGTTVEHDFACVFISGDFLEIEKLLASDAAASDGFGISVAVSGDTAIVGALFDDDAGVDSGSAYIFARNQEGTNHWGEVKNLTASDAAADDWFGFSVAINGETAIVGAIFNDDGGNDSGSAYMFSRNEGGADNWGEVKKLTASDAATSDRFGRSVAVSGDTAIVGAHRNDDAGTDSGSAYIFRRNQGGTDNWGEVKKLTASDAADDDRFGWSVASNGDTAIVGALFNDDAGSASGSAYIFQRNQGGADNWGEVKKLTASDAAAGDEFGFSVAVNGDTAIVGADGNDDDGNDSGSAYIFSRNEGGADNWGEVKKLTASDAAANDFFGVSVASNGDTAIVGALFNDDAGSASGSAYIFQRNQGGADNWGEVKKLTASDAAAGDQFGRSVAISGDTSVVGAYLSEGAGSFSGSAYIFDSREVDCNSNGVCDTIDLQAGTSCDRNDNLIPDECEPYCIADLNCSGFVNVDDLLLLIGAWGPSTGFADLNLSGSVNVDDLLLLVGSWGPCL